MKNILLLILFPLFTSAQVNNYGDDTADVYLLRSSFHDHLTLSLDRKMTASFCCAAMGPNNLRICYDPANGVTFSGGDIQVNELYEVVFTDAVCGKVYEAYSTKNDIYLEYAGDQFPYALVSGHAYNVANQIGPDWSTWEWDSLIQFGIPDTNLAHAPIAQHMDVYPDSCTGISVGRMDCYHGNPFYLDSVEDQAGNIVPLPNGTYWITAKVNLPPTIYSPHPLMHQCTFLCNITGNVFQWTTIVPPAPAIPSQPTGQSAIKISGSIQVSWNGAADHYSVQLYKSNPAGNIGRAIGSPIETTNKPLTIPLSSGGWIVAGIRACNCAGGCSTEVWTNPIKK